MPFLQDIIWGKIDSNSGNPQIGMPTSFVAEVSGHSTRVGAAQDLAELDIDLAAAITQLAGGSRRGCPCNMRRRLMRRGREWRERRPPPAATNRSLKRGKERCERCGMALHESYKWAIMWRVPQPCFAAV